MGVKNNYAFYKNKNISPLDNEGNPLFSTRKDFYKQANIILGHMGLISQTKQKVVSYKKKEYLFENFPQYGSNMVTRYRKFYVHTGNLAWGYDKYIYLDVDLTKISLNTILRDFKVKKNSHAFVINYYSKRSVFGKRWANKIIAIPIVEAYSLLGIKSFNIPKYKGCVKILENISNIFKSGIEIRTLPDNKLLKFEELCDYFATSKPIDIYKALKVHNSIFDRTYTNNKKEETLIYKPFEEHDVHNLEYKKKWILNEFPGESELLKHSLKVFPCLINQYSKDLYFKTKPDEVLFPLFNNIRKVKSRNILYFYTHVLCNFDKSLLTKKIIGGLKETYTYCYYNHKELNANRKYISNVKLLSDSEIITIKSLILPKSLELFKNQYKSKERQKQFNLFLEEFILEVFGQLKYDKLYANKSYKENDDLDLDTKLNIEEHIKHTFISDKQFNLFIDSLKDKYKGFNIKPNANIKYKLLKSFGLNIDENYVKQLFGKTITNSLKDIVKDIRDSKRDNVYIIFNMLSNLLDNIIIICVKILADNLSMLNHLDSVLSESYEKIQDDPPDEPEKQDKIDKPFIIKLADGLELEF